MKKMHFSYACIALIALILLICTSFSNTLIYSTVIIAMCISGILALTSTKRYVQKFSIAISGAAIVLIYVFLAAFPFIQRGGLSICIEDMAVIRLAIIEYHKINNAYPKENELKTALDLFFMTNKKYPVERLRDLQKKVSLYEYNLEDSETLDKWLIKDKNPIIHCEAINTIFLNGNRKVSYGECTNINKLVWLFKLITSKNLWYGNWSTE